MQCCNALERVSFINNRDSSKTCSNLILGQSDGSVIGIILGLLGVVLQGVEALMYAVASSLFQHLTYLLGFEVG